MPRPSRVFSPVRASVFLNTIKERIVARPPGKILFVFFSQGDTRERVPPGSAILFAFFSQSFFEEGRVDCSTHDSAVGRQINTRPIRIP